MHYKCAKFQLAILTNKLFMVKGIGLTHSSELKFGTLVVHAPTYLLTFTDIKSID